MNTVEYYIMYLLSLFIILLGICIKYKISHIRAFCCDFTIENKTDIAILSAKNIA